MLLILQISIGIVIGGLALKLVTSKYFPGFAKRSLKEFARILKILFPTLLAIYLAYLVVNHFIYPTFSEVKIENIRKIQRDEKFRDLKKKVFTKVIRDTLQNGIESVRYEKSYQLITSPHFSQVSDINKKITHLVLDGFRDSAKSFFQPFYEFQEGIEREYYYSEEWEIFYLSNHYLVLSVLVDVYTGGAHNQYSISSLVYQIDNLENTLELEDIFNERERTSISKLVLRSIRDQNSLLYNNQKDIPFPEAFLFNQDTIKFLYNPYEIGRFSSGIIQASIPYINIWMDLNF